MPSEQNVINSIIRSYFTASGKATDRIRYYSRSKEILTVIRVRALSRERIKPFILQ